MFFKQIQFSLFCEHFITLFLIGFITKIFLTNAHSGQETINSEEKFKISASHQHFQEIHANLRKLNQPSRWGSQNYRYSLLNEVYLKNQSSHRKKDQGRVCGKICRQNGEPSQHSWEDKGRIKSLPRTGNGGERQKRIPVNSTAELSV